jgi:hypothetical protein
MKSLRDYLAESEHRAVNPAKGDDFVFEFDDGTAVETYIIEASADEILVDATEETWAVMEQWVGFDDILSEGCACEAELDEAEYQGRKVPLGKPMRGDVKKYKVYVRDPKTGNIKKVNFGHGGTSAKRAGQKTMRIRKSNPKARKSFRARHNCANPGPRTGARYWSCRNW